MLIESNTHVDERKVLTTGDTIPNEAIGTGIPTQVANPSRASWRTFVQSTIAFLVVLNAAALTLAPFVLDPKNGLEQALGPVYGWLVLGLNAVTFIGGTVAKAAALLMANPLVNEWIVRHLPWLAPIKPLGK